MASPKTQRKKGTKRKLTAILCADVVAYSRLMGADEEATIETLTAYRKVFTSEIKKHRGRVVDAKGDAILAEFASVVDAVSGAVDIQKQLAEKNAELPDDRRMDFRIGINLGDVVVKDDAIYGDGVNIAARLEALAEPGGICISRPVFDQVESKLNLECEYLGEQEGKNIAKPVRAYLINLTKSETDKQAEQPEPVSAQSLMPDGLSLELPDRPSIAVLPFDNMSGHPDQQYFSDGISEDIITELSKLSGLLVIARNSSFVYKGHDVDVKKVGRELGVRNLLEGSVRRAGTRVRISAQLLDTRTGEHLWAERYDRELDDIFRVQDEITTEIVAALDVKLMAGEQSLLWRSSLKNHQARDRYYRGLYLIDREPGRSLPEARRLFEEVIRLEPDSPWGYVGLGRSHFMEQWFGLRELRRELSEDTMDEVIPCAHQALALDESNPEAHSMLGMAYLYQRRHDAALVEEETAVRLSPNNSLIATWLGVTLLYMGRHEEAIAMVKKAIRLCPFYPNFYLQAIAAAYRELGQYDQALETVRMALRRDPDYYAIRVVSVSVYCAQGRDEDARAEAQHIYLAKPRFSIQQFFRNLPFKNTERPAQILADLERAGTR